MITVSSKPGIVRSSHESVCSKQYKVNSPYVSTIGSQRRLTQRRWQLACIYHYGSKI